MVSGKWFWPLMSSLALCAPRPASADDILERMQSEVVSVAMNARGAVVSIEDARIILPMTAKGPMSLQMMQEWDRGLQESLSAVNLALADPSVTEQTLQEVEKSLRNQPQGEAILRSLTKILSEQAAAAEAVAAGKQSGTDENTAEARAAMKRSAAVLQHLRNDLERSLKGLYDPHQNEPQTVTLRLLNSGSGFSIGGGYVLTTADVLEGMSNPIVVTDSGMHIHAKIVGIDPELNVGLVKLPERVDVPGLKLGDSTTLTAGHFAIAIGNQSGQSNAVTLAMVEGVRTEGTVGGKRFYPNLVQIAGVIGAGSSGAPLLNTQGEVVGMIAAIPTGYWTTPPTANPQRPSSEVDGGQAGPDSGARNMPMPQTGVFPSVASAGFAIPINDLKLVIDDMRAGRQATRGFLGVFMNNDAQISDDGEIITFHPIVRIGRLVPDSPAVRAGIQPGDILVSLNGKPVTHQVDVYSILRHIRIGDTIPVELKRSSGSLHLEVKIEEYPKDSKPAPSAPPKRSGSVDRERGAGTLASRGRPQP